MPHSWCCSSRGAPTQLSLLGSVQQQSGSIARNIFAVELLIARMAAAAVAEGGSGAPAATLTRRVFVNPSPNRDLNNPEKVARLR